MKRVLPYVSVIVVCLSATASVPAQRVAFKMKQPELVPATQPADDGAKDAVVPKSGDATGPSADEPSEAAGAACANPAACGDAACECNEASCACNSGCCDSCGSGNWSSCLGDCCLGDPWTLQGCLQPCCDQSITYGGWFAFGYLSDNDRLSVAPNDLLSFEDHPDRLDLDQAWFYTEKLAKADGCGADWGYRFDIVYGVDAQKMQAFGNNDPIWDVTFDHGSYGWAMPQAYVQLAYGDWDMKAGHFFTPLGYEVIPAVGNFFFSHSLTMFNSEPFTHTGVLLTNTANDRVTYYAGWTLGWDTAWDQNNGGNNFLGGFGVQLSDDVKYTYLCTAGNLGFRGDGYSHSNVFDITLSKNWQYVLQSDYVHTNLAVPVTGFNNEDVGVNQYLFYTLNDCWKLGGRMEWWKSNNVAYASGRAASYQEITGGVNYKPHANVVIRPEIRYNWTNESVANNTEGFNNTAFGIDAIFTF